MSPSHPRFEYEAVGGQAWAVETSNGVCRLEPGRGSASYSWPTRFAGAISLKLVQDQVDKRIDVLGGQWTWDRPTSDGVRAYRRAEGKASLTILRGIYPSAPYEIELATTAPMPHLRLFFLSTATTELRAEGPAFRDLRDVVDRQSFAFNEIMQSLLESPDTPDM